MSTKNIVIIGGGPAGLMAAEIIANAGHKVTIYDRMPSFGRKFLMAGRGGLNITHSEDIEKFISRYGAANNWLAPHINKFSPEDLQNWCHNLGQETFVGSSGRVFPKSMKAAPLLRAWLQNLNKLGVQFEPNHNWLGWQNDSLKFAKLNNEIILVKPDATLLALGGASWPRLGSNGAWVNLLEQYGVEVAPLAPSNCGFLVDWSDYFKQNFAGTPLKPVALKYNQVSQQGEIMITEKGIEGGAVYALSALLREGILANGKIELQLDLRPDMPLEKLTKKLQAPRGKQSLSSYLRKAGFAPLAINLLREVTSAEVLAKATPEYLAARFKALPIVLTATTDIARAISSAGGVKQNALNDDFMLTKKQGVFVAGEMLNWEAPTGGYLLQACFSTAIAAANGLLKTLNKKV
jgi:uncharacterized flavoprotein (TIGR03862 family)